MTEDDLEKEENLQRPEEVVFHEGERAVFSGTVIEFVAPAPEKIRNDEDHDGIKDDRDIKNNYEAGDEISSRENIFKFSSGLAQKEEVEYFNDSADSNEPGSLIKTSISFSADNNRNRDPDGSMKLVLADTDPSNQEDAPFVLPFPGNGTSEENNSSNQSKFFSQFFETESNDSGELTKSFENALHNIFNTNTESDSEENAEGIGGLEQTECSDSSENETGADSENELSDSERWQQEEEQARQENLDALIKQNDADSLFELGAKYEPPNPDLLSIEEPKNTEVRPESILEAMLFVGDRQNTPLDLNKAVSLMRNVSVEEAVTAIDNLNRRYERSGAPYWIIQKENGYSLELRSEFEPVRDRFFGKIREFKLSQKTIDLLALIAYRQPISLQELSDYNSGCVPVLSSLLKRDLIAVEKKPVEKKMISYYRTTDRFLKIFNLESLDDLPIVEEINYR